MSWRSGGGGGRGDYTSQVVQCIWQKIKTHLFKVYLAQMRIRNAVIII